MKKLNAKSMALVAQATELLEKAIEPHNPSFDKGALTEQLVNTVQDAIDNKIEASASTKYCLAADLLATAYTMHGLGNTRDALSLVLAAMKDESAPEFFDALDTVNEDSKLDPASEDIINGIDEEDAADEEVIANLIGEDDLPEESDYDSEADDENSDSEEKDDTSDDADPSYQSISSEAKTNKADISVLARGNLEDL